MQSCKCNLSIKIPILVNRSKECLFKIENVGYSQLEPMASAKYFSDLNVVIWPNIFSIQLDYFVQKW